MSRQVSRGSAGDYHVLIIILLLEIRKLKHREINPSLPANRVKENLVSESTA